jgi:hypothetical protein
LVLVQAALAARFAKLILILASIAGDAIIAGGCWLMLAGWAIEAVAGGVCRRILALWALLARLEV